MSVQVTKEVWTEDSKFAFGYNKFILWPLGIWPLDYDTIFSNVRFTLCLVSQLWLIYNQISPVLLDCGNLDDYVDYLVMATCAFMAISKIIIFRRHMSKIRTVLFSSMNDWINIEDKNDRAIMLSFAKTGRKIFKLQIGFSYLCTMLILIFVIPFLRFDDENLPIISETTELAVRVVPVKSICLSGHYRNELYGLFIIILTSHGNVGCDVVVFSLLMHLCGQIELIKKDLRAIAVIPEGSKVSREKIMKFIQKHIRILELAKHMEITASGMLVIQLLCNTGLNLMLSLRVVMALQSNLIMMAVHPFIGFVILMLQLYLIMYASDRLARQSQSIVDTLYECKWYELSPKLREILSFVAMRANKPVNLVAGKFYDVNIENFKNMLIASFSYFSVLRVMFDKIK